MGGGGSRPKAPAEPAPTAQPVPGREEDEAKKKVRSKRGGRASTIFAGRLNAGRLNAGRNGANILNTRLG